MAQMGLLWCPRQASSDSGGDRGGQGVAVTAVSRRRGTAAGCAGIGRLMRKLRKLRNQGRTLCSASRSPAAFRCQYDPLSYALNFDGDGFGDDASHFAFSSRFVSGASFKCPGAVAPPGASVSVGATTLPLAASAGL